MTAIPCRSLPDPCLSFTKVTYVEKKIQKINQNETCCIPLKEETCYHPSSREDKSISNLPSLPRNLALKYPTFPSFSILPFRCKTIFHDGHYTTNTDKIYLDVILQKVHQIDEGRSRDPVVGHRDEGISARLS